MSQQVAAGNDDLLEALAADQRGGHRGCIFCTWLQSRPPEEQAKWKIAMADAASYNLASLYRQAVARGWKRGDSALHTHRNQKHA